MNVAVARGELDWRRIGDELDAQGAAVLRGVFSREQSAALAACYPRDELFRSRVIMARHGFGRGAQPDQIVDREGAAPVAHACPYPPPQVVRRYPQRGSRVKRFD